MPQLPAFDHGFGYWLTLILVLGLRFWVTLALLFHAKVAKKR